MPSAWLTRLLRPGTLVPLALILGGGVLGVALWGGLNWAMEASNNEAFCISCHEMRDNVYREYQKSPHYTNRSGVRATCPDCHVPKEWGAMVVRKAHALNELYHAAIGTINTREKFQQRREYLAEIVWNTMQVNDSLECRNCHDVSHMGMAKQSQAAQRAHQKVYEEEKTCIDCHKGIAHQLPEEFLDREHERVEQEKIPCGDCHSGLNYAEQDDW